MSNADHSNYSGNERQNVFLSHSIPGRGERDDSKNEKCKCKLQLLSLNITAQLMFYFQLSRGAIIRAIGRTTFPV